MALALGVSQAEPGLAGGARLGGGRLAGRLGAQWKIPSLRATATAWERSLTSNLR